MENRDLAIPYSCSFKMTKIHGFKPFDCAINIHMTMILRIKFTGMPNQAKVMEYIKNENLKCKVHEDE